MGKCQASSQSFYLSPSHLAVVLTRVFIYPFPPLHALASSSQGKVVARGKDKLQYGEEDVDLSGVEQLVEVSFCFC